MEVREGGSINYKAEAAGAHTALNSNTLPGLTHSLLFSLSLSTGQEAWWHSCKDGSRWDLSGIQQETINLELGGETVG